MVYAVWMFSHGLLRQWEPSFVWMPCLNAFHLIGLYTCKQPASEWSSASICTFITRTPKNAFVPAHPPAFPRQGTKFTPEITCRCLLPVSLSKTTKAPTEAGMNAKPQLAKPRSRLWSFGRRTKRPDPYPGESLKRPNTRVVGNKRQKVFFKVSPTAMSILRLPTFIFPQTSKALSLFFSFNT